MSKNTYEYAIENEEDKYTFESALDNSSWVAEDAAEDFYNNHDGWEATWPIEFSIFSGEKFVGTFSVDCEAVPHFMAYPIANVEVAA